MTQKTRQRYTTVNDWYTLLNSIRENGQKVDLYKLRQACYRDIEELRQRPLLVYAVQFPLPHFLTGAGDRISINLEDVDGFSDLVESISIDQNDVDVLIHSPGGSPEATERIVEILRTHFSNVSFLVPHSAYSAATMLALSGDEIILHHSACLGPIDPQINGVPARALRRGFDKIKETLKEEGPEALPVYLPLLEKHSLEIFEIAEDYEKLSRELVTAWLQEFMFKNDENKQPEVDNAVAFFSNYDIHRTHSRALTYRKLQYLGLNINPAPPDLQLLMREAYVLLSGFFDVTPFVKLFENSNGLSWGRQFAPSLPAPADPPQ